MLAEHFALTSVVSVVVSKMEVTLTNQRAITNMQSE
jgi:hypothetical protein